jgi:hypothetical protein
VFAYRFTWKLRNYMQHCDLPFGRVEFVCTEGITVDSGATLAARLTFDPQVLLKQYDEWGPVRNDLEQLHEAFEVSPILAEVVAELTKIESRCIEMEVPDLRGAINAIQSIIGGDYDPKRGFAVVDPAELSHSASRSGATIAYQIILLGTRVPRGAEPCWAFVGYVKAMTQANASALLECTQERAPNPEHFGRALHQPATPSEPNKGLQGTPGCP